VKRRVLAVLVLAVALLGIAAFPAIAGGPNNVVNAEATAALDGSPTTVNRSALQVLPTGTGELTSLNFAQSFAHDCTGCRAVAVAIQAVVAHDAPSVVTPRNFAVAANLRCTGCLSYAYANQLVFITSRPPRFAPGDMQQIAQLRRQVADLANSDIPLVPTDVQLAALADLTRTLDAVVAQVKAIVSAAIDRAGARPSRADDDEKVDAEPAEAQPAPAPAP
jgi:hypothetical protein